MAYPDFSVFEYLYRDASNFKAHGSLLLRGSVDESVVTKLRGKFESGEYFIAEQIGTPTLYESLWNQCQSQPSEKLDHVWHEFSEIRAATRQELTTLDEWGSSDTLVNAILNIESWNLALSRNWML